MRRLKGEGFARCARLQGGREGKGRERKDPGLCQGLEETGSRIEDWCQAKGRHVGRGDCAHLALFPGT